MNQEDRNDPSSEYKDISLVKKALEQLGEHFDSVQIFCTRYEPEIEDGTIQVSKGIGNWFARYGSVKEWTIREESEMKSKEDC